MAAAAYPRPPARTGSGFTLIEVLLAMLLLGACLIPATYALRDAVRAPADSALAARNLDCVSALMEAELAQPYDTLHTLALNNPFGPFAAPADPNCPPRQIRLQLYGVDATRAIGPGGSSRYLLYLSVGLANAADGNPYTLTTLVSQ